MTAPAPGPPPSAETPRRAGTPGTAATLQAKKAEIQQQLGVLEAKPGDQGSISFGKRVGEGTSMAVDRLSQVAVHDKLQITLADVDRAMAKVADGSYGRCDTCGEPVGDERQEALPWATQCVRDAGRR
jgi:RNA polymerase-binding transcription factor DksA